MDNRANYYKSVFKHQIGEGFDFPEYHGRQYGYKFNVYHGRPHYVAKLGDVFGSIWRFFRPVAITGAKSLLKAGSEAIKDGVSFKDVLKQTLIPTVALLLSVTAEQVASRLAADQLTAAPSPGPSNTYTVPQIGTGSQKRKFLYKRPRKIRQSDSRKVKASFQLFTISNNGSLYHRSLRGSYFRPGHLCTYSYTNMCKE